MVEPPTSGYNSVPESDPSSDYFSKSAYNAKPSSLIDTYQTTQGKTLINSIFSSSAYNPKVIRPTSPPVKDIPTPKSSIPHIRFPDPPTSSPRPTSPRFATTPQTITPKSTKLSSRSRRHSRRLASARSNRKNHLKKFPSEKTQYHVHFSKLPIQPPSIKNSSKYYKFGSHLLFETNEHKRAALYLKKSADLGNYKAASLYGMMLNEGNGIEKDEQESAHYLKIAADAGDIEAIRVYAMKCRTGSGVEYSLKEAVRYYQMAADSGDIESAKQIVKILDNGCQFLLGKRESVNYYKMLADRGDADALNKYNSIISKLKM